MKRAKIIASAYGAMCVMVGGMLIWGPEPKPREGVAEPIGSLDGRALGEELGRDEPGVGSAGELEVGADGLLGARPKVWRSTGASYRTGVTGESARWVWAQPLRPPERAEDPGGPYLGGLPVRASPLLEMGIPEIETVATILHDAGLASPLMESSLRDVYGHVQRLAFFKEMADADAERLSELNRAAMESRDGSQRVTPEERLWLESWISRRDAYLQYVRKDLEVRLGLGDAAVAERLMAVADGMAVRSSVPAAPESILPREGPVP